MANEPPSDHGDPSTTLVVSAPPKGRIVRVRLNSVSPQDIVARGQSSPSAEMVGSSPTSIAGRKPASEPENHSQWSDDYLNRSKVRQEWFTIIFGAAVIALVVVVYVVVAAIAIAKLGAMNISVWAPWILGTVAGGLVGAAARIMKRG